jgi:aminocarboxymuconate-semialdehyde decarboxylase
MPGVMDTRSIRTKVTVSSPAATPNRRQFLAGMAGATAGVFFGRPSVLRAARRQVVINGRRAKVVDGHAHCTVPEALNVLKDTPLARSISTAINAPGAPLVIAAERVRQMDEQGIDVEVLSINPFWYAAERDLAGRLIAVQNERLAAVCAAHPGRFAALASVALQHPDLAVTQLDDAVTKHGMRGAAIGGTINGEELSSARFDPFWSKAQELDALIFVHPQGFPEIQARVKGNGFLSNVIGNPLETTVALSHLIFEGTLDRFPRLRICAAHGGGFLPSYAGRFDHGCLAFPANCSGTNKKPPSEYLKQLYFDALVFTEEGLRHLVAECGASQIVLGTDAPFPWTTTAVDHVLGTRALRDADRIAILGGNLIKLLRLDPVS